MQADQARRLTPKLRELVATDRLARPPVGRLTRRHVEDLRALVADPSGYDERVSVPRALAALAAGTRPAVAVPVLREVLGDGDADTAARVAAARGLATVGSPAAADALADALAVRDPRVQQAVAAGLAEVGGERALRALVKTPTPAEPFVRRQVRFATAVVAHRLGRTDGPFLPETPAPPDRDADDVASVPVAVRLRSASATEELLATVVGPRFGVELAERSLAVECGGARLSLLVNAEVGESVGSPATLFERPLVAGLLASEYPVGIRTTARMVVLTRPTGDDEARIEIVRRDGRVAYVGTVERAGRGVSFRVTDVDQPASARTLVVGTLTGRGVSLDVGRSAARRDVAESVPAVPGR